MFVGDFKFGNQKLCVYLLHVCVEYPMCGKRKNLYFTSSEITVLGARAKSEPNPITGKGTTGKYYAEPGPPARIFPSPE